jgi:hypothetical protein
MHQVRIGRYERGQQRADDRSIDRLASALHISREALLLIDRPGRDPDTLREARQYWAERHAGKHNMREGRGL